MLARGIRKAAVGLTEVTGITNSQSGNCDPPLLQDLFYGGNGQIDLFVGVIEVRREADAGFGTPVHEDVASEQVAAHLLGVGHVDGDGPSAPFRIARGVDAPSVLVGELDQTRSLAL